MSENARMRTAGAPGPGSGPRPAPGRPPFDAGGLQALREELQVHAVLSGVPDDRAVDIVLAVHELAANAIVHGGAGRLRMWKLSGALQCQVDDGDLMRTLEQRAGQNGTRVAHPSDAQNPASTNSLPYEPGHGLWVARCLADRMQSLSGTRGTSVIVTFGLPVELRRASRKWNAAARIRTSSRTIPSERPSKSYRSFFG